MRAVVGRGIAVAHPPTRHPLHLPLPPRPALQVFADGLPLTPARWPNALLWTETWWSREEGWGSLANGSTCGHAVDAGTKTNATSMTPLQTLEGAGVSFDGCAPRRR